MNSDSLMNALGPYFRDSSTNLVCAYLFGSRARGDHALRSDVDIAVLFPADNDGVSLLGPSNRLRGDLERLLGLDIDLVDMRRAPVDLIHRILRDGRLLVDRAPHDRVAFEVRARNEYFDLLPHMRRYRRGRAA